MDRHTKTARDYLPDAKLHPVDETPKPKWATAPDARYTDISGDDRFDGLFADWQADACRHEKTGIIRWVNAGGQTCFNWYCAHCGVKLSSNIPHDLAQQHGVVNSSLDSMASRSKAYVAQRQAHLAKLTEGAAERAQPENREHYDDYLRSDHWRGLRAKIMRRAGGQCEGCLSAPADHVHHRTYENRGNEFAFELIAVCQACHERLHQREAAE